MTGIINTYLSYEDRASEKRLLRKFTDCTLGIFLRGEFDDAEETCETIATCILLKKDAPASLGHSRRCDENFGE
jgi:hypothetical protein